MAFNKVLLPLAYQQGIDQRYIAPLGLCHAAKGLLILVTVIDDLDEMEDGQQQNAHELLQWVKDKQLARLTSIKDELLNTYPKLRIQCQIEVGRVLHCVTKLALEHDVDAILLDANRNSLRDNAKSGSTYSGASHFGSTTRHLMRKSPVPVWALSQGHDSLPASIAVAIDVTAQTKQEIQLNRKLLSNAVYIANACNSKLMLLHCWTLYGESYMRHWERTSELKIAQMSLDEKSRRRTLCQALLDDVDKTNKTAINLIHGYASKEIPQQVSKLGIDLLIMGTVCRTGIAGLFIGNTAESILNAVNCPVITFKPDEFVSPVVEQQEVT